MYEKLMDILDCNHPRWWTEWADQRDLIEYANSSDQNRAANMVRNRVINRIFYPIINAAIEAGLVTAVK